MSRKSKVESREPLRVTLRRDRQMPQPHPLFMAYERLNIQAIHFMQCAKDAALASLDEVGDKKATRARQHIIRSETYREAASILDKMMRGEP
mgnify:CR=1 FL=1